MIRRILPHPILTVTLVLVWLLLLNELSVGGVVVAMVVGVVVPIVTAPYWPDRPKLRVGWSMFSYLGVVLWDILVASFEVAWIILTRPNNRLRSSWLVVPLDVGSPEAITALAGTISLTPGTVSVDVSACGRSLLVHALDVKDEAAAVARIKSRYEGHLQRIFT